MSWRGRSAGAVTCVLMASVGCQSSSYAGLEQEDARRVALEAVQEESAGTSLAKNLTVVRTVKGRSRAGNDAWLVAFSPPRSSEVGCVWVWRPGDYRYEIDSCPRPLAAGRPPGGKPPLVGATFDHAFKVCSAASREELAVTHGLPGAAPRRAVARAVASPAAGLLDPRGEAYRGCLAGMKQYERLARDSKALATRP
jgi:hypothetical protein